jgi:hypothetical protein
MSTASERLGSVSAHGLGLPRWVVSGLPTQGCLSSRRTTEFASVSFHPRSPQEKAAPKEGFLDGSPRTIGHEPGGCRPGWWSVAGFASLDEAEDARLYLGIIGRGMQPLLIHAGVVVSLQLGRIRCPDRGSRRLFATLASVICEENRLCHRAGPGRLALGRD